MAETWKLIGDYFKRYVLFVLGILAIFTAANAFKGWGVSIDDANSRLAGMIAGFILIGVGIYFKIIEQRNSELHLKANYGIKINSPISADIVQSPFVVTGSSKKKPPTSTIYAFEYNPKSGNHYGKNEVIFSLDGKSWSVRLEIGNGNDQPRDIKIVALGKSGKFFYDYYNRVIVDTRKEHGTGIYVGTHHLPPDAKLMDEVRIILQKKP